MDTKIVPGEREHAPVLPAGWEQTMGSSKGKSPPAPAREGTCHLSLDRQRAQNREAKPRLNTESDGPFSSGQQPDDVASYRQDSMVHSQKRGLRLDLVSVDLLPFANGRRIKCRIRSGVFDAFTFRCSNALCACADCMHMRRCRRRDMRMHVRVCDCVGISFVRICVLVCMHLCTYMDGRAC